MIAYKKAIWSENGVTIDSSRGKILYCNQSIDCRLKQLNSVNIKQFHLFNNGVQAMIAETLHFDYELLKTLSAQDLHELLK